MIGIILGIVGIGTAIFAIIRCDKKIKNIEGIPNQDILDIKKEITDIKKVVQVKN